jgi:hypothetical protein
VLEIVDRISAAVVLAALIHGWHSPHYPALASAFLLPISTN